MVRIHDSGDIAQLPEFWNVQRYSLAALSTDVVVIIRNLSLADANNVTSQLNRLNTEPGFIYVTYPVL